MRKTDPAIRYTLAIFAACAALFLRHLLTPLLGNQNPYHTVWLAVVFSAWYCGLGPSIVTTLLGVLGVWYWFVPPFHSFAIQDRSQAFGMFGFLAFSAAIIALGESNRRGFSARSRLAAIVESSGDAIISKNLDGIIASWNKGAEQLFGYSSGEALGRHITLIVPADHRSEEEAILERLRRGERVRHFETVRMRKDGTTVDVSLTISPVKDGLGRVVPDGTVVQLAVTRDITHRKEAEKVEREKELSARLLKLQDEERRRIARELHDGVGQVLAAMSINASRIEKEKVNLSPDAARSAEENSKLIEQVSADIRTMSYLFHPPLLDEIGLPSALQWYIDGFAERSRIAAKLEMSEHWERLPEDYELCLFRIAQECLTNIHRHSGSPTALLRLVRSPEGIRFEVSDEGRGIDQDTQAKFTSGETAGVGLRGMRERMRQLGGSLEIQSNGTGTTVTAILPVRAAENNDGMSFLNSPKQKAAVQT